MATVTKPIALDESFNTTEQTPRNIADVLAQALQILNTTISGLNFINCVVVPSLPTTGISTTTIYLVPKSPSQQDNIYDEYINLDGTVNGWEKIGDTEIDLSNYYTKTQTDTLLNGKVDTVAGMGLSHNDFTDTEKTKLSGIESGAEVNVQSDWSQADSSADDYIKNKPSNLVQDASYVHTDNNFTNAEKTKLGGIESGAEVNVQSDWSQSDNTADDYIKNKPSSEVKSATDTFTTVNGGLLEECIINLEPVQSGSGDPSPDNVRPISGHTEVDLVVKDGDNVTQHTYQVQIGSTVYGGTVDLVSGVMTVDRGFKDLGSLNFSFNNNTNWFTCPDLSSEVKRSPDDSTLLGIVASSYTEKTRNAMYADWTLNNCIAINISGNILIRDLAYDASTLSDFQTHITGQKICYKLATPFTIQLTPQQIEALVGQNNLSCPLDGQSIQTNGVEYREVFAFDDVEKVVSLRVPISMLGTDESGRTTASQSYTSGDYFYKDGYMCKALTSISAGATLTLNTNYSQGTLADILKAIENA